MTSSFLCDERSRRDDQDEELVHRTGEQPSTPSAKGQLRHNKRRVALPRRCDVGGSLRTGDVRLCASRPCYARAAERRPSRAATDRTVQTTISVIAASPLACRASIDTL